MTYQNDFVMMFTSEEVGVSSKRERCPQGYHFVGEIIRRRIPLTDWAHNAHSMTVQRGQNAHYVPSL